MQIKKVTVHELIALLDPAHHRAYGQGWLRQRSAVLAEVETDDGVVGWGESYDNGSGPSAAVRAMIEYGYAPIIVGANPLDTDVLWERCYHAFKDHGRKGIAIEALSAIDIALWDLKGKLLGQPIWRLLGGRFRDRLRTYATGVYWHDVDDPTEAMIADARALLAQGFNAIKMGGGYGVAEDIRRAAALREAIGPDVMLALDANQSYTAGDAVRLARGLEPLGIEWLEEPVPPEDLNGYVVVRNSTSIPIAGAEVEYTRFGFNEVLSRGCVDIIQPDITATGGFTEYRRLLTLASVYNTAVFPHGWVSAVGQFANLHLTAAIPSAPLRWRDEGPWLEMDRTPNPLRDELTVEQPEFHAGLVAVPDRPGLGITVRRETLERYAARR